MATSIPPHTLEPFESSGRARPNDQHDKHAYAFDLGNVTAPHIETLVTKLGPGPDGKITSVSVTPTNDITQRRRRGKALEDAILDAAWEELATCGWDGFTVDGVAARSGTAKSVIYRRWGNRVELAEALLERGRATAPVSFESRGDLRTDLREFGRGMAAFLRGPFGDASRGVAVEGGLARVRSVFNREASVEIISHIVGQARARGELAGEPSPLALNVGYGVVMWELIHARRVPTDVEIDELVDAVWLPAIIATSANGDGEGAAIS